MTKKRYLEKEIEALCFPNHKMAFISGPRQCGKTTLSKRLLKLRKAGAYHNWDELKFRKLWTKDPSHVLQPKQSTTPLIILDELHKAKGWKRALKGVFDTMEEACDILVTGSARLNVYRKGSDSLLGRYYHFRLHPLSLREISLLKKQFPSNELLETLFSKGINPTASTGEYLQLLDTFGPFPEPLLIAEKKILGLWQRNRLEKVIREDLRDMSHLTELSQVEMLASLLPERVGSMLSLRALGEDLEVAYTTVKRWLTYLRELYYTYEVKPYHKKLMRSIKKTSKLYLWDWSCIEDPGARFENLIASHLLKYCHYLTDTGVGNYELNYLRLTNGKEIDFLILENGKPWLPVEVKLSSEQLSPNWKSCLPKLPCKKGIQVVLNSSVYKKHEIGEYSILLVSADYFLAHLV